MFLKSKVTIGDSIKSGSYYFASHTSKNQNNRVYYTVLDNDGKMICLPEKYFESTVCVN